MSRLSATFFIALMAAAGIASAQLVPVVPGVGAERLEQRRENSANQNASPNQRPSRSSGNDASRTANTGNKSDNSEGAKQAGSDRAISGRFSSDNSGSGRLGSASAGSDSSGSTNAGSAARGMTMECRQSSVNCPVTNSSGSDVTSTDALPPGSSTGKLGGMIEESRYPTSPGSGSMGSGATGSPTGPSPGPVNGIGR
jgi:hypothetical protein